MDHLLFVERIIKTLTGTHITVWNADVSGPVTIENRNPQKKIEFGLSFPGNDKLAKAWEKHLKKTDLSFSVMENCVLEFCRWRKNQ